MLSLSTERLNPEVSKRRRVWEEIEKKNYGLKRVRMLVGNVNEVESLSAILALLKVGVFFIHEEL